MDSEIQKFVLGNIWTNTVVILGFIIASTIFYIQRYLEIRSGLTLKSIDYLTNRDLALMNDLPVEEQTKVIDFYDNLINDFQNRVNKGDEQLSQNLKFIYALLALSIIIVGWTILSITTDLKSTLLSFYFPVLLFIINLILMCCFLIIIIKQR